MKFLILLLFFTLNAFAVTTVNNNAVIGKTLKVADRYMNDSYIDGSFENDLTGWTGDGTFTATTSGSLNGTSALWALTGTGTRVTTLDTTKLSGTDLEASIFTSSPDTSLYFCVTVSSVDSCVQNVNNSGWHQLKVYFNASTSTIIKLKYLGASLSGKFDEVKIAPMSLSSVQTVEQESVTYTGYTSGLNPITFTTVQTNKSGNVLQKTSNSRVTFLKTSNFSTVVGGGNSSTLPTFRITLYNSTGAVKYYTEGRANSGAKSTAPLTGNAEIGDYLEAQVDSSTGLSSELVFSITAIASRDNVIQSYQDGSVGEIKYLPQNVAPNGFIPCQGQSIGNTTGTYQGSNYFQLYTILWQVAQTTAGEPYVISSAKGTDALTDWNANKTITMDESGLFTRAYKSGTSGAVGAKQADAFQGHYHPIVMDTGTITNGSSGAGSSGTQMTRGNGTPSGTVLSALSGPADNGYGTPRVASETRPTNVAKYPFIRFSSSPTLLALPVSKENVFSARISSAGAIVSQNADWINSVTLSGTSIYTINISKLGLTSAPSISGLNVIATTFGTSNTRNIVVDSISATQIVVKTGVTDTNGVIAAAALDFSITIQKQSPDYTPQGVFIPNINPDGFNKTAGQTGLIDTFSVTYGTGDNVTPCSAPPCSYIDKIGSYVTNVTRLATGVYPISFSKTFTKLKCNFNGNNITGGGVMSQLPLTCSNCSSIQLQTVTTANAAIDSTGTLLCQGY